MKQTFNPCDECEYSYSKQNQESGMCKICEFKKILDLEEQGKLLKLPCAVGDTVYVIDDIDNEPEIMSIVTEISIEDGNEVYIMISDGFQSGSSSSFGVDDFGKTVFLIKEAAEAALKEMSE